MVLEYFFVQLVQFSLFLSSLATYSYRHHFLTEMTKNETIVCCCSAANGSALQLSRLPPASAPVSDCVPGAAGSANRMMCLRMESACEILSLAFHTNE